MTFFIGTDVISFFIDNDVTFLIGEDVTFLIGRDATFLMDDTSSCFFFSSLLICCWLLGVVSMIPKSLPLKNIFILTFLSMAIEEVESKSIKRDNNGKIWKKVKSNLIKKTTMKKYGIKVGLFIAE